MSPRDYELIEGGDSNIHSFIFHQKIMFCSANSKYKKHSTKFASSRLQPSRISERDSAPIDPFLVSEKVVP